MQRDHLKLIQCVVCQRWYVVRVQSADLRRHLAGEFVQTALPYVPPQIRELWISGVGPCCWPLLCGSNPLDYD